MIEPKVVNFSIREAEFLVRGADDEIQQDVAGRVTRLLKVAR